MLELDSDRGVEAQLTIAPAGNGDEKAIAKVLDADWQPVLGDVVAAGQSLLLEPRVRKGEVQLVPAIALLQLVGGPRGRRQQGDKQQRQDASFVLEQRHGTLRGSNLA